MRWLEAMGIKRYMCICDGCVCVCVCAREKRYLLGRQAIECSDRNRDLFFTERVVLAPENKTLKMERERERQQQQKRSQAICCRDYQRITQHSTA